MSEEFSCSEHEEPDGSVRVRVAGELDAAEAPTLQDVLRRLEEAGRDVLLDLSGLTFMDLFGLHVIEEAADAARRDGFGFAIEGPVPKEVRRVFIEAGAVHHLPGRQAHLAAEPPGLAPGRDTGEPAVGAAHRDRAFAAADQSSGERDQTAADEDQTGSDRDQDGSDADQTGSDRDQAAADRDQRAADRDHAAYTEAPTIPDVGYEHSRQARRRSAQERGDTADARRRVAEQRDRTAAARDEAAAQRDATAAERDRAAYGRDRLADLAERSASAEHVARRARGDRQRAQMNREQAARDRDQAARDREQAARDRERAARDRDDPDPHDPDAAVDGT